MNTEHHNNTLGQILGHIDPTANERPANARRTVWPYGPLGQRAETPTATRRARTDDLRFTKPLLCQLS